MVVFLKLEYESSSVYESFYKELDDNITIKELNNLINKECFNWFSEYVKNLNDYTEEEKQELLNTFLNEHGKYHWSIENGMILIKEEEYEKWF